MSDTKHTPWALHPKRPGHLMSVGVLGDHVAKFDKTSEAEFAVRACNAHDDKASCIQAALLAIGNPPIPLEGVKRRVVDLRTTDDEEGPIDN